MIKTQLVYTLWFTHCCYRINVILYASQANGHVPSGEERNKSMSPLGRVLCSPVRRSNSLSNKNNGMLTNHLTVVPHMLYAM